MSDCWEREHAGRAAAAVLVPPVGSSEDPAAGCATGELRSAIQAAYIPSPYADIGIHVEYAERQGYLFLKLTSRSAAHSLPTFPPG